MIPAPRSVSPVAVSRQGSMFNLIAKGYKSRDSIYLSVCMSIYLSTYLCVCVYVYL